MDGREAVILSTAVHEKGHGIFEAPKWVLATQQADASGVPGPHGPKRVHRTITPDENHLAATPPRGSAEFFEEVRANAFMGTFVAPIHRVYARLCHHCGQLGVSPSDLRHFDPGMLSRRFECIAAAVAISREHLNFIDRRLQTVDKLLTRLARDFGVTRRFIEVRLIRYGFIGQARAVALKLARGRDERPNGFASVRRVRKWFARSIHDLGSSAESPQPSPPWRSGN